MHKSIDDALAEFPKTVELGPDTYRRVACGNYCFNYLSWYHSGVNYLCTKNTPSVQCAGRGRRIKTKFWLAKDPSNWQITPLEFCKNINCCGFYAHFEYGFPIFCTCDKFCFIYMLHKKIKHFLLVLASSKTLLWVKKF